MLTARQFLNPTVAAPTTAKTAPSKQKEIADVWNAFPTRPSARRENRDRRCARQHAARYRNESRADNRVQAGPLGDSNVGKSCGASVRQHQFNSIRSNRGCCFPAVSSAIEQR